MKTTLFKIEGMNCDACASTIKTLVDASAGFKAVSSAFDKAAKSGVIHKSLASRKKSRLASRLAHIK